MVKRKVICIAAEDNIIVVSDFRQNIICYIDKDIFIQKFALSNTQKDKIVKLFKDDISKNKEITLIIKEF